MKGTIDSLQVGKPETYMHEGRPWTTAISKRKVEGPLRLLTLSFEGDGQADLEHHGGRDKAVCVYCREHYPYWEQELGVQLTSAAFGENVTLTGLLEDTVRIGDIFRMGTAVVQVSQPRQPCYKLGYKYGRSDMPLLVQNNGYTGYYFRVLEEGLVCPGDTLELLEQSPYGITVAYANRIMHHEKDNVEGMQQLLDVPELSESWRITLRKRISSVT